MRVAIVAAMVMALSASGALAASDAAPAANNSAPLAPAKPAGVAKAQIFENGVWVLIGVGAAIAILGVSLSNSSQQQNFTSSTQ